MGLILRIFCIPLARNAALVLLITQALDHKRLSRFTRPSLSQAKKPASLCLTVFLIPSFLSKNVALEIGGSSWLL